MKTKTTTNRVSNTMVRNVATGVLISMTVCVLLAIAATSLMIGERLKEDQMNIITLVIIFIAVITGATAAGKIANGRYALITALTGFLFLLILMCLGIMFFDGGFSGIWTSAASTVAGIAVSCLICITETGGKRKKKIRTR